MEYSDNDDESLDQAPEYSPTDLPAFGNSSDSDDLDECQPMSTSSNLKPPTASGRPQQHLGQRQVNKSMFTQPALPTVAATATALVSASNILPKLTIPLPNTRPPRRPLASASTSTISPAVANRISDNDHVVSTPRSSNLSCDTRPQVQLSEEDRERVLERVATATELRDTVLKLKQELTRKDEENEQLADALLSMQSELRVMNDQTSVAMRKELVSKYRDAQRQIGKEKATIAKLEHDKKELETQLTAIQLAKSVKEAEDNTTPEQKSGGELEVVKKRLQATSARLTRLTAEVASMKAENSKLKLIIQKEVGDSAKEAIDDPGSWRGRAEQITILKQKITELQQVITNLQEQQRCTQRNSQETDKIYNHRVSHRGQDDSACTTHRSDGDSVSPHNAYDEGKSDKACEGDSERLPTSSRPPLPPHSRRMMRPYSQPSSFTAVPTSLPDNNKHPSSRGPNRLSALNSKRTLLGNAPLTPNTLYPNNTTSTTTSLDNLLHGIYPPAFMAELEAKDLLISREKQKLHVAKARIQSLETQTLALKDHISALTSRATTSEQSAMLYKQRIVELEASAKSPAIQAALSQAEEAASLRTQNTDLQKRVEDMDVEIAKKEKEILRLREIRSVFVRTNIREWMIADAKQKEEVLRANLSELESEVKEKGNTINVLKEAVSDMTKKLAAATSRIETLEKRLSNKQGTRQLNNPGEKTTPLKEQLEVITAEKILITTTLTENLHRRDEEINRLTETLRRERGYHARSISSLTERLTHVEKHVALTGYGPRPPNHTSVSVTSTSPSTTSPTLTDAVGMFGANSSPHKGMNEKGVSNTELVIPMKKIIFIPEDIQTVGEGVDLGVPLTLHSPAITGSIAIADQKEDHGWHAKDNYQTQRKLGIKNSNQGKGEHHPPSTESPLVQSNAPNHASRVEEKNIEMADESGVVKSQDDPSTALEMNTDIDVGAIVAHLINQDFAT